MSITYLEGVRVCDKLAELNKNDDFVLCLQGLSLLEKGQIALDQNDFQSVLDHSIEAENIFIKIPEAEFLLAICKTNISAASANLSKYDDSITFGKEAINIINGKPEFIFTEAAATMNVGMCLKLIDKEKEALSFLFKAKELFKKAPGGEKFLLHIEDNINDIESYKNDEINIKEMLEYAEDAMKSERNKEDWRKYERKELYVNIQDITTFKLFLSKASSAFESKRFANEYGSEYGSYLANEYGRYISKIYRIHDLSSKCYAIIGKEDISSAYFNQIIEIKEIFITSIQKRNLSVHIGTLKKLSAFYNVGVGFVKDDKIPFINPNDVRFNNILLDIFDTIKFLVINVNELKYLGGSNVNCFIATAIYGDINAPEVKLLRQFRDNELMLSRIGKLLIKLYYSGIGQSIGEIVSHKIPWTIPFIKMILDKIVLSVQNKC